MPHLRLKLTAPIVLAFPLFLAAFVLASFFLPPLGDLIAAASMVLYAVFATAIAARSVLRWPSRHTVALLALAAFTWVAWVALPMNRIGGWARLQLETPKYEAEAASEERQRATLLCAQTKTCSPEPFKYYAYTSGYFLAPTLGVLRVPGRGPKLDHEALQRQLHAVDCEPEPLALGYYWCNQP